MAQKLEDMKAKIALVNQFFKDVMEKDVDFGIIPGTQKPSLYQPGADKLCSLYNLAKMIVSKEENKNFDTGHYDATVKVQLVHRGSGVVVGELEGSCSTMESKYRYRWVGDRDVPRGIDKETLFFKEYDGKFGPYKKYRIENDDLYSQWNTVLKMAIKRAYVGCTLASTGLSGLFSQEEDELDAWIEGEEPGQGQGNGQGKTGNGRRQQNQNTQSGRGATGSATRGGSGGSQKPATENQIKAIFGSTRGKGLSADDAKALVAAHASKSIDELTTAEASGIIDLVNKSTADDLYVIIDAANNPGENPPEFNEGGYQ